jgi:aspartate carbamoyltransferase catalytic subunit
MGAQVVLCGPPTLLPWGLRPDHRGNENRALPLAEVDTNIERAIEGADVVMALRLQLERQQAGLLPSLREYVRLYQVDEERLAHAKPSVLVMHPGPINEGIELSPAVAHGARSVIEEQVTNGVAVRMALLYLLAKGR